MIPHTHDLHTRLHVGGRWRAGRGTSFTVLDPATEDVIASVESATTEDADEALDAAQAAMGVWQTLKPRDRSEILRAAFDRIVAAQDRLAHLITLENGKALGDARAEVAYSAEFFRWFAEEAVRIEGAVMRAPASGARIVVHYKPAGLAMLVTPWNFPLAMGTRKIAPALAAGCGMLIKPASETPLTMLALMPLLEEAGVPHGLINVLPTSASHTLVDHVMRDPRVRVLSFTGSTEVGRRLLQGAAKQILNPAMELGGNAPLIVFDDADLDQAVAGTVVAKMRNGGEACTAANRIYVQRSIARAFTDRLVSAMSSLKMGPGNAPGVDVGPLVNAATRDKVAALVADAVAKGARIECGGIQPSGKGFYYPPTVLSAVPNDAACLHEEIFGPVAAIQVFTTEDEVITRANDTAFGLVAYLFCGNTGRGLSVAERLEFGMVGVNRGLVSDPAAPFGGVKQSGLGREGGHEGILEFLETQYVAADW